MLGYVALSRGRVANRIWTTSERDLPDIIEVAHGTEPDARDPLTDLRHAMGRSAAQQLATDQPGELEPVGIDL